MIIRFYSIQFDVTSADAYSIHHSLACVSEHDDKILHQIESAHRTMGVSHPKMPHEIPTASIAPRYSLVLYVDDDLARLIL